MSKSQQRGFMLLEAMIAVIIVGLAMIPMMQFFWSPDIRAYERADVDQILILEMFKTLYDKEFLDHSIHTTTGRGAPLIIELKWTHQNHQHCINAQAFKSNKLLSELTRCRYE